MIFDLCEDCLLKKLLKIQVSNQKLIQFFDYVKLSTTDPKFDKNFKIYIYISRAECCAPMATVVLGDFENDRKKRGMKETQKQEKERKKERERERQIDRQREGESE